MKPMEMAEALFGNDDAAELDASQAAPQDDNAAMAAIAAHLLSQGLDPVVAHARAKAAVENARAKGEEPPKPPSAASKKGGSVHAKTMPLDKPTKAGKSSKGGKGAKGEKAKAAKAAKRPASSALSASSASATGSASFAGRGTAVAAGRSEAETRAAGVTLLGNQGTRYPQDYDPTVLETFDNKHPGNDYFVKFNCPEFTSLCPITGQPDFATIYISYVPGARMVESKSLKLYLFSFRNHGDFHEDCMNIIMKDLIALMDPKYIEVWGKFTPRGGISIDPYVNYGRPGTPWEQVAWDRLTHHDMYPEKVDNR